MCHDEQVEIPTTRAPGPVCSVTEGSRTIGASGSAFPASRGDPEGGAIDGVTNARRSGRVRRRPDGRGGCRQVHEVVCVSIPLLAAYVVADTPMSVSRAAGIGGSPLVGVESTSDTK